MDNGTVRVLLIEDDPDDYYLTRELLADDPENKIVLEWVSDFDAGLDAITRGEHDVFLVDYRLGKGDGLTLLREGLRHGCKAPMILLTGQGDRDLALQALDAGASDFLVKGKIDAAVLERSIRYALQQKRHTDELERKVADRTAELERANAALHASFKEVTQLRTALDVHAIVEITDARGRITFVNDKFCAISKYSREELLGQDHRIINSGYHSKEFIRELWTTISQGLVWQGEIKNRAKDGCFYWVATTIVPFLNEEGKPRQYVIIRADITEHKLLENLAKNAREYAENILSTLRHAFLVLDKDLRVVTANRAFYNGFSVTSETTQGRLVYELGNAQWDIPRLRTLLEEILPGVEQTVEDFEVEHDFPGVGARTMLLNARRVVQPGVQSELILLGIEDITERRCQEQLVVVQREYAQNILSTLRHAFLVLDKDLRVVPGGGNGAFYKGFAVTPEETQGRLVYELGNGQWDILALRQLLEEVLPQSGTVEDFEVVHEFEGIGAKVMLLNARRVLQPGVQSELILLGIEDITERKHVEESLHDSEIRFRRLFEAAKDGILILDVQTGKITDANAFMGGLVGQEPSQMLGKQLHEIGMFGDTKASKAAFRELQEKGYLRYEYLPVQNQTGGTVEVEMVANVYREGHTQVAQCNIRDISERVVLEQRLAALAKQLSGEARRKDEFLATLAHELRNPLAPVRNAVEVLRMKAPDIPELHWATEIIDRQTQAMARLIDDLMDISRINQGKVVLKREQVELAKIVQGAVETSLPLIEEMGHKLTVTLPPGPVIVDADLTRLAQVFLNLLNNAAKYTERGGRIDLRGELQGSDVVVSVTDSGIGIPADKLPTIFEMFSQVEGALSRSQGGLGIGLCLVKRLVEMHGGSVEAKSGGPVQGSEFVVRLPIVVEQTYPRHASDDCDKAQPTCDLRILVVDDNRDAAETLAMLLKMMGNNIHTAYDGEEAVAAAGKFRPHVVLCDIGLPKLNGYEACRQMKAQAWDKKMILIAVTGWGQDDDRRKSQEAGFDHHMVKPVDPQALMKLLAELNTVKA